MLLKVANLSKRYKDKWVLRDISFDVSAGEVFGICGPAGAGKTTLLAAIGGAISHNGGSVDFDGKNVLPATRQTWVSYPSPIDGGPFWQRIFGISRTSGVGTDIVEELSDQLSRADHVVLLDDPFSGLDLSARKRIREIIGNARDRGLVIILATADFETLMSIANRSAILVRTEIKQSGTPKDLYEDPESTVVATATGRCNLFEARRLSSSKAEIPEFHTIEGGHRLFARSVGRGSLGAINQNVTLGIRPEHISISFGASFPEDNLLRATITAVQFLGPTTLVDLDCDGLRLESLVLRLVGLKVGDECVVGLPPERVHIFKS